MEKSVFLFLGDDIEHPSVKVTIQVDTDKCSMTEKDITDLSSRTDMWLRNFAQKETE
jgi:hypothetical protein